jgi:hypothetical protein
LGHVSQTAGGISMNETIENLELTARAEPEDVTMRVIEIGRWMGRREAFAAVAGRCAAADIECLRHLRDERKYRDLDCTWAEFCAKYLKVSRRSVDRLIGHLDEFGPAYFHLTKLTHISVGEYRQIAASVTEAGIEMDGSVVALLPENTAKLAAAITALLERMDPPEQAILLDSGSDAATAPPASEPSVAAHIVALCEQATGLFLQLGTVEREQQDQVIAATWNLIRAARQTGCFLPGA